MSLSLTALKASFESVSIDGNGVLQSFAGIVNIGSGASLNAGSLPVIAGASQVQGTVGQINGITLDEADGNWQQVSTGIAVNGNNGVGNVSGAAASAVLTEGAHLIVGSLQSGNGAINSLGETPPSGGNATVNLDGSQTTWSLSSIACGSDGSGNYAGIAGSCYMNLASTQTSASFNFSISNASTGNYSPIAVVVTGGTLTTISLTLGNGGGFAAYSGGPTFDFSGTVANSASVSNIIGACASLGLSALSGAALNVAGGCAPASTVEIDTITLSAPSDGNTFGLAIGPSYAIYLNVAFSASIPFASSALVSGTLTVGISDSPALSDIAALISTSMNTQGFSSTSSGAIITNTANPPYEYDPPMHDETLTGQSSNYNGTVAAFALVSSGADAANIAALVSAGWTVSNN